jgi:hypothetical protein
MGVVYEALDGHLGRPVGLKILPHDAVANPARKQRFVQEAKTAIAQPLAHLTIYDIDSADGVDYIIPAVSPDERYYLYTSFDDPHIRDHAGGSLPLVLLRPTGIEKCGDDFVALTLLKNKGRPQIDAGGAQMKSLAISPIRTVEISSTSRSCRQTTNNDLSYAHPDGDLVAWTGHKASCWRRKYCLS